MSDLSVDGWTDRLSEYLDGALSRSERAALERHLETCGGCREVLVDLRALAVRVESLEDRAPVDDLWPAIARRLEAPRPSAWTRLGAWVAAPRFAFTLPQLAAAAAVLVVLSGGGMWLAMRGTGSAGPVAAVTREARTSPAAGTGPASGVSPAPSRVAIPDGGSGSPTQGEVELASYDLARYDATISELQRVIQNHRADLDTSTVRIIEQNLAIIDRAIGDARRALESDPSNTYLNGHLTQQLQRKVRLLQRATDLVAVRQG